MLAKLAPDFLVRLFARPYVAGDRLEDGMEVASELVRQAGITTTLDLLAEEVDREELIEHNLETYRQMIRAAGTDARFPDPRSRPTVSVKLSSFTMAPLQDGGDAAGSKEAVRELATLAREHGVGLTLDMEDRFWTSFTLDLATALFREGFDVGTVLQTRLHRTEQDIEQVPQGMRIRTVIGIYPEPADVALVKKKPMKARLLEQSARLLEKGVYVEIASHDERTLTRFFQEIVVPRSIGGDRYEVQMLYGVPRGPLLKRIRTGALSGSLEPPKTRLYVPFATHWSQATAYCRRRLANNPDLALYVIKNLVAGISGRKPGLRQYQ